MNLKCIQVLKPGLQLILILACFSILTTKAFATNLSVTLMVTHEVTCHAGNDGEVTAYIFGGMQPYSYQWSNNKHTSVNSSLSPGTYTVTVSDAMGNQAVVESITLAQPVQMYIDISSSPVSAVGANDGSAEVNSVIEGVEPFTYSWSPYGGNSTIANNLEEGNYEVLVTDAEGCTASNSVMVESPNGLEIQILNIFPPTCSNPAGGSIEVRAINGIEPYYFWWSPYGGMSSIANNLVAGTFIVYAMDANGTYVSKEIILTGITGISAAIESTNAICNGSNSGTASVTVSGGTAPYTYDWIPNVGNTAHVTGLPVGVYHCLVTDANGCSVETVHAEVNQSFIDMAIEVSILSHATCSDVNGASATVNVTGGQGPYSYLWSPSGSVSETINGISGGSHTVMVTDANGCALTETVTVSGPSSPLTLSNLTVNDVTCEGKNDGSIAFSINGGDLPYNYSLNNVSSISTSDFLNLETGTYVISVSDANGCSLTQSVNVEYSSYLNESITADGKVNICNGEDVKLLLSGISGNTYAWKRYKTYTGDTGSELNVNKAGNYKVEVTTPDGCIYITNNIKVAKLASPEATIDKSGVIEFCANEPVKLSANKGPGLTYMWYRYGKIMSGETKSQLIAKRSGRYRVVVENSEGCNATSKAVRLIRIPRFSVELTAQGPTDLCAGDTLTIQSSINGGYAPYTYQWKNYSKYLSGETNDYLITTDGGAYKLIVTDNKGCIYASSGKLRVYNVSCRLMDEEVVHEHEKEIQQELDISVYPNPFRESINVVIPSFSEDEIEIRISDLFGRRIYTNSFPGAYEYEISVKGVENGYYIMEVIQGNRSGRVKMLKQ